MIALADLAVAASALVAALAAVAGLSLRGGARADIFASFAPFAFGLAVVSALLAWTRFGPDPVGIGLLGLCAVGALASLANIVPELARLRPSLRAERPALRVLSGNLYRMNPMGEQAVAAILARDPDVVVLQESGRRLTADLAGLRARYPHMAVCPHAGLTIYAKVALIARGCQCASAETPRGRLLTATFALPDGTVAAVATTHFSQPYRGDAQPRERRALAASVGEMDTRYLVLAGDFNTTPWSPGMRRQDEMLAPLRRRTIAWFTWPSRLLRWDIDWPIPLLPIDHVYAGPGWGEVRLRRVRLPGSDHFATEAALWLASAPTRAPDARPQGSSRGPGSWRGGRR